MSEWFSRQALGSLPADAARRWGAREALSFQGRRWTFAELSERVDRVARGLMGLGIAPGEHVALWMLNLPEFIDAAFAVMKIGAVLVPINTRFRTEDLAYVLAQSDASTLLIAERSGPVNYLGMVRQLAPSLETARAGEVREARFPRWKRVVVAAAEPRPEMLDWRALVRAGEQGDDGDLRNRAAAVDPEAAAFIMYTSGTTGFPKGAMHCHRIVRNLVDRAFRLAITPADTIMMYLPLFHLFGFSEGMLMSMVTGARQILTETFDPPAILALMAEERPTILHGFDTHFKDLMEALDRSPRELWRVRTGICATGMSSSVPVARRARHVFGRLVSRYGMSEFGARARLRAQGRRPGDRPRAARRHAGRDPGPELHDDAGLLQAAGGDREDDRPRGLGPHGGHGAHPRGRPPALPRTLQGHAEDRRRERRPDGGRGVPHGPSSDQPGGGGRLPRRAAFRGRRRVRQARARGGARRGGGDRLLSGQDRELQDPPPRDLRRRVPDDGLGQDPEGEAARGGTRAVHPRVEHPSRVTISLAARIS